MGLISGSVLSAVIRCDVRKPINRRENAIGTPSVFMLEYRHQLDLLVWFSEYVESSSHFSCKHIRDDQFFVHKYESLDDKNFKIRLNYYNWHYQKLLLLNNTLNWIMIFLNHRTKIKIKKLVRFSYEIQIKFFFSITKL